jgi:DnaK suppressor protein
MLTQEELKEFETKLIARKEQILKNLDDAYGMIAQMRNMELREEGDLAAVATETDIDNAIAEQQRKELAEIEIALGKIKDGTYGICEMCEEPIGKARLEVKNFARYCIACREIIEKEHTHA